MSYSYRKRSDAELNDIARAILARHPKRRTGDYAIDIEGILEDLGFEIIFRPWNLAYAAYAAVDPRYIVVNELGFSYLPRVRFTLAEEVAHKILEWELWDTPKLPEGACSHELEQEQYGRIEQDAKSLAGKILLPDPPFTARFDHHKKRLSPTEKDATRLLKAVTRELGKDFDVSPKATCVRAKTLNLISKADYQRAYPVVM